MIVDGKQSVGGQMRRRIRVNAGIGSSIGRAALCLATFLFLLPSNFPASVMAETASTTLDNASSTSNDSAILSSYSAYRSFMNGKASSDRHRKKSKGKEKKKTAGTAAVKYNKDKTATIDEHLLLQFNHDNNLLSTPPSTTHSQQELTLAIAKHRQTQESSSATTSSSTNLCSCSPKIFTLTFNPTSLDCTTDTLKDNAGIKGTLCLLSDPAVDSSIKPLLPDGIVGGGGGEPGEEKMPTVTPTYMNDDEIATSSPTCAGSDCLIPVPVPVPVEGSTDMPSSSKSLPSVSEGGDSSAIPTVMSMGSSSSSSDGPTSSTYAPTYANGGSNSSDGPTSSTYRPSYTPTGDTSPGEALIDAATATNTGTARDVTASHGDGADEISKKEEAKEKLMRTNSASLSSSITTGGMEQTLIPTVYMTPYKTYEPTVLPTYLVDDDDDYQRRRSLFVDDTATTISESPTTISHAQNFHDHITFVASEEVLKDGVITDDGRTGRRLLHDKWKSIPLNDEFFVKFPEFKSRQEDIYHLRRSEHTVSSNRNSVGKRNLNERGINNRQSEAGDELTLADIAAGNDDFSTLLEAITAADLLGVLSGPDPLTVFGTLYITLLVLSICYYHYFHFICLCAMC